MVYVHETAIVSKYAEIGQNVSIGPYSIIEENVKIGRDTQIGAWVLIKKWSEIGERCIIHSGVVIGDLPQHRDYSGERSFVIIGNDNIIREYVTIHRAIGEEKQTQINNNNFIMANAHIAHNCKIGNFIIITNFAGLTGHVEVEDYATISGLVAIHQFVRIGKLAMVGGASKVVQDVVPFMLADGHPACVYSLNIVGLKRHNIRGEKLALLKQAYKILYRSNLNRKEALERLISLNQIEEIKHIINFIKNSKRGICKGQREERAMLASLPAMGT